MSNDAGVRSVQELRDFSTYIKNLSYAMTDEFNRTHTEMFRISEGWNDTQNSKFMAEFDESVRLIHKIAEHMEDYSQFINRKCDILDQYGSL